MRLVCAIVVLCLAMHSIAATGGKPTCNSHTNYTLCTEQKGCSWCGSKDFVYPNGVCYETGSGTCCVANQTLNYYCSPSALICTAGQVCNVVADPNEFDPECLASSCCTKEDPVWCGGDGNLCYPKGTQCCDNLGGTCNGTSVCCGTEYTGLACCDPHFSSCCESPDGYSHWCCPLDQECDPDNWCTGKAQ